jgi:molecular chaperone GrpE
LETGREGELREKEAKQARLSIEGGDESPEEGIRESSLQALKKKNEELVTRLKYAQADLENLRKRTDKELREAGDAPLRGLVTRLLVVLDELELAVRHSQEGKEGAELKEGVKMVERNLWSALESAGLERIDCAGKPFDPSIHEAVEKVQGSAPGQDVVVQELRAGYTFRGRLLRPSMVKVQLATVAPAEEAKANE